MGTFASRRVRIVSRDSAAPRTRRKSVEDTTQEKTESEQRRPRETNTGETDLPPNENLRKDADEVYGDTEIPGRKNDV
jgi:hypothetical protein